MNRIYVYGGALVATMVVVGLFLRSLSMIVCKEFEIMKLPIESVDDVVVLFPRSPEEIQ